MIPLEDLNATNDPYNGSMWHPVPGIPDGTQVPEGSTVDSSDINTPEPASMAMVAIAGLLTIRRRRGN
jgi:hypothetical protein